MIAEDDAAHSQQMVWRGDGGSLKDGAEVMTLFQRGAQLYLWSRVLTVLDRNEVWMSC